MPQFNSLAAMFFLFATQLLAFYVNTWCLYYRTNESRHLVAGASISLLQMFSECVWVAFSSDNDVKHVHFNESAVHTLTTDVNGV